MTVATQRKSILLRLDPAIHDALVRWAGDELRSTNAQIEFLLRKALAEAGRLPRDAGGMPRRGRPRKRREADAPEPETAPADDAPPDTAPPDAAPPDT